MNEEPIEDNRIERIERKLEVLAGEEEGLPEKVEIALIKQEHRTIAVLKNLGFNLLAQGSWEAKV